MNVLITIAEGIPGALVATVITVLAVRMLPPRIEISKKVAVTWSNERDALRNRIKIVNKSRRMIVDLRFELVILYHKNRKEVAQLVSLDRSEPMSIAGHSRRDVESGGYSVAYDEKLIDDIIQREADGDRRCRLRFRVFGRDSFSGVGKQFTMTYDRLLDDTSEAGFTYGSFGEGTSLEVDPLPGHERWLEKLSRSKAIQDFPEANGQNGAAD